MGDDGCFPLTPLLLGRPFMKTARTMIDVHKGTLTMEFDSDIIYFNILEDMKHPNEVQSYFTVDRINPLNPKSVKSTGNEALEVVERKNHELKAPKRTRKENQSKLRP